MYNSLCKTTLQKPDYCIVSKKRFKISSIYEKTICPNNSNKKILQIKAHLENLE